MNTTTRLPMSVLWGWPLLAAAVGCASLNAPDPTAQDITQKRQQRAEEAVRAFESKRDFAEFQAALGRWNQSGAKDCEEGLQRLLQRNPNHRDARLLMAELYLTNNRPQAAFSQAEQALRAHPDDARVQYTVGLLLDATGQSSGALAYYERATKLDPDNELYGVSYHTALQAAKQAEAPTAGSTGPSSDLSNTSPQPALSAPDPTAQYAKPLPLPAGQATASAVAASPADHTPGPPTSLRFVSHTETADRRERVDSADVAGTDPVAALVRKGHAALAAGAPEVAASYFREAAASRPNNPQIPISAAVAALRYNQPDLAIGLLRPVEERFSGSAQVHRILGAAHYRLGDYKSSQVALQQALSLDKSSALSYLLMGCTLAKLGQFESAEAHLRQARTINPGYAVRR